MKSDVLWMVLVACVVHVYGAPDADLIQSLPGLSEMPSFKQYSGYLDATGTRHLHYWFVESAGSPESDPVVLWMNGGPGCSSLAGLLMEHGPFRAMADSTLSVNPYSWNNVANVIYLEAPAGVGYSYSDTKNYTTGDDQTSLDNLEALKSFFRLFPEYSGSDFYITGESYGGIYVPTLAVRVAKESSINLKGFVVGNGMSDFDMSVDSMMFFGNYHGLWGKSLWDSLVKECCVHGNTSDCNFSTNPSPECVNQVTRAGSVIGSLNVYNLYQDCVSNEYTDVNGVVVKTVPPLDSQLLGYRKAENRKIPDLTKEHNTVHMDQGIPTRVKVSPPCIDASATIKYLNLPEVKRALHIHENLPDWDICSDIIQYRIEYKRMNDQYLELLATSKYRVLVYNGDVDMACNFLMDEWFVDSLKQKVVSGTQEWFFKAQDGSQQVGGFIKQFENLSFVTVKGAGHMVPTDKPIPALTMITNYLKNQHW